MYSMGRYQSIIMSYLDSSSLQDDWHVELQREGWAWTFDAPLLILRNSSS